MINLVFTLPATVISVDRSHDFRIGLAPPRIERDNMTPKIYTRSNQLYFR